MGLSLAVKCGWAAPEVEEAFSRARQLCEESGNALLLSSLRGLSVHTLLRADLSAASKVAKQFWALTRDSQDTVSQLAASNAMGMALWAMGEPDAANEHFEHALALYSQKHHLNTIAMSNEDLGSLSRRMLSICLWNRGYPDRALAGAYEAVALAHQLSHPFTQGGAHYAAAHLHLFRREWQACQEHAEVVIKLAEDYEMGDNLTYAVIARDAALAYQGNPGEGIAQMLRSIEAYRAKGANLMMTCYLGLAADLYGMEWQIAEGLNVVDEALAMTARTGERWWEAELHRTKGKLLIKRAIADAGSLPSLDDQSPLASIEPSTLAETEACFQRAMEVAGRQNAKSLELRAATSLGRFWWLLGKKEEARAMVVKVLGWFTEGADTADLNDAKALIDELR